MAEFADSTAVSAELELLTPLPTRYPPALPAGDELLEANLYAVSELVAGGAALASSARQYGSIYTRSSNAFRDELGRPPVVADMTADVIAAYSRDREQRGGRGGRQRRL
jgi:hypothetical protein